MIGDNVTNDFLDNLANHQYQKMHNEPTTDISVNMDGGVGGSWKEVTNKVIADNLIDQVAELLGGKAHYIECSDRTTYHKKIVIEYDHTQK